jgi:hypothetical protein
MAEPPGVDEGLPFPTNIVTKVIYDVERPPPSLLEKLGRGFEGVLRLASASPHSALLGDLIRAADHFGSGLNGDEQRYLERLTGRDHSTFQRYLALPLNAATFSQPYPHDVERPHRRGRPEALLFWAAHSKLSSSAFFAHL